MIKRDIYKYNPAQYAPEILARHFVGGEDILQRILRTLKLGAKRASNPHFLLIGPRGMGKTHNLLLIFYIVQGIIKKEALSLVKKFKNLGKYWIPVLFLEETYSVNNLEDLFFEICKKLQDKIDNTKLNDFLERTENEMLFDEYFVNNSVSLLNEIKGKKKYLLLIDNLHEILMSLSEVEQEKLRGILQNNDFFVIVGSAISYFESISEYKKPFYNFFQLLWLREMESNDIKKLLEGWFKANQQEKLLKKMDELENKIKAVVHLTGGNPRLVLSLYQIISEFELISVESQLLKLLEELTPYMRDRVSELPPQQKKILDVIAQKGSPLTPTDIAQITKLKVQTISSQLKRIGMAGHIKPLKVKGRRQTLYDIKDKLYSLWRQMRLTSGKRRLGFISHFLEIWYSREELIDRAKELIFKSRSYLKNMERERAVLTAEKLYYIAEAIGGSNISIHFARINTYIDANEFSKAKEEIGKLEQQAREKHDKEELVSILNVKGKLYYINDEYDVALEITNEMISYNPKYYFGWFNKGLVLRELGRSKKALEAFDKAIKIKPDYLPAWHNKGIVFDELGRFEEALEAFDEISKMNPDDVSALSEKGIVLDELGRHEEALKALNESIEKGREDGSVWNNKGIVLGNLGRHKEAIKAFDKAIRIESDNAYAWNNKGIALGELGSYEEAIKAYDKATEVKPNFAEAWYNKGFDISKLGRYEEALEAFSNLTEIRPDFVNAWNNKGITLSELGRNEEALKAFEKAIEIKSDFAYAWNNKGIALGELGRNEEALKAFEKAIEIEPDDEENWNNKGITLGELDRHEEALKTFEKAIEIRPDFVNAWNNKGITLGELGRNEEALKAFEKATEIKPDEISALTNYVFTLLNLSLFNIEESANYKNAMEYIKQAVSYDRKFEKKIEKDIFTLYLNKLLNQKESEFLVKVLKYINENGSKSVKQSISPYLYALEYIKTKDKMVLLRTPQTIRDIVEKIAQKLSTNL